MTLSRAHRYIVVFIPHPCLGPTVSVIQTEAGNKLTPAGCITGGDVKEPDCVSKSLIQRHTKGPDTASHRLLPILQYGGGRWGVMPSPRLTSEGLSKRTERNVRRIPAPGSPSLSQHSSTEGSSRIRAVRAPTSPLDAAWETRFRPTSSDESPL